MNAIAVVEDEVRELVRRRGLDPVADPAAVRRLVDEVIAEYDDRSLTGSLPQLVDPRLAARAGVRRGRRLRPVAEVPRRPDRRGDLGQRADQGLHRPPRVHELTTTILTADEVRDLVEKMLKSSGRRVDLSTPVRRRDAPGRQPAARHIPDITRQHWSVNIRKFVVRATHLEDLVQLGTLTAQAARFLEAAVASGLNVLVAGGTQAGKTTLLNCLAAAIPTRERVVTCEEVFELKIPLPDVVACSAASPASRAPARSSCAGWSRKPCGCARRASSSARSARRRASTC